MQLVQVENINLVQVDIDASVKDEQGVLIDSRDYCRDVIKVNHSDWLQNVLYKHQSHIEKRFGVFRFENGKPQNDVKGGRPTKYALMNRAQTNALLTLSNNDEATVEEKLQLIADFEDALKWRTEYLERSLAATPQDTSELDALKAENKKLKSIVEVDNVKKAILKAEIEELKKAIFKKRKDRTAKLNPAKKTIDKVAALQAECYIVAHEARGLIYDYQDISEGCGRENLEYDLIEKLSPKLKKAVDLGDALNELMGVDIDLDKLIDDMDKPENTLMG